MQKATLKRFLTAVSVSAFLGVTALPASQSGIGGMIPWGTNIQKSRKHKKKPHREGSGVENSSLSDSSLSDQVHIGSEEAGWYMRIRVQATAEDGTKYAHNTGGIFGELKQSKNGKDRHDIPTFAPAIFHVVFPHYYWKEASGDYDSDYRHYDRHRTHHRRVWTFQVKNQKGVDLSDAPLQIRIDDPVKVLAKQEQGNLRYIETKGDPKMKRRFTLVDVDNRSTYTLDELDHAQLSMDGNHTRTFRLVRGQVRERDFQPVKSPK